MNCPPVFSTSVPLTSVEGNSHSGQGQEALSSSISCSEETSVTLLPDSWCIFIHWQVLLYRIRTPSVGENIKVWGPSLISTRCLRRQGFCFVPHQKRGYTQQAEISPQSVEVTSQGVLEGQRLLLCTRSQALPTLNGCSRHVRQPLGLKIPPQKTWKEFKVAKGLNKTSNVHCTFLLPWDDRL